MTRIHHKNLVSMVGYCKDGEYMALVYEYMSEGTLQEHIAGISVVPFRSAAFMVYNCYSSMSIEVFVDVKFLMFVPLLAHRK